MRKWKLELQRRLRRLRGLTDFDWPPPPPGVFLNPSDADFIAYATARLELSWSNARHDPKVWQAQTRSKLVELLGITGLGKPAHLLAGGDRGLRQNLSVQTVYLESAPRRHVPVTVVWEDQHADKSLPVMICLQGHTSGAHISWGEPRLPIDVDRIRNGGDFACQAVRHGHVAVCIEQISFGTRRENAIEHRWDHTCIDASNRALLMGRTLLGDRVADVIAVAEWLRQEPPLTPRIDAGRIRTMGNSAGGETALFAAAIDPGIESVIASGCVGSWRKTSGTRKTCPDTIIPGILNWMEYSDVLGLCAPRPTVVVSGTTDHLYPFRLAAECAEEAREIFTAFGDASALAVVSGAGGHRFYPDSAWPIFTRLMDRA